MFEETLRSALARVRQAAGPRAARMGDFSRTLASRAQRLWRIAQARYHMLPRPAQIAGLIAGALAGLWFAGMALVLIVLSISTISIGSFTPTIVSAVEQRLPPGMNMTVSGASLARDGFGVGVRLDDVEVKDAQDKTLFASPGVTVSFGLLSLATGDLSPEDLKIDAPRIAMSKDAGEGADTMNAADIIAAAFVILNREGGIEELAVKGATLVTSRDGLRLEDVNVRLIAENSQEGGDSIALEVSGGAATDTDWAMNGRLQRRADGGLSGEVAFADLVPQAFTGSEEGWGRLVRLESPISGQLAFATLAGGALADARFDMLVGAGRVKLGDDVDFLLDEARISGIWDASRRALRILPSRLLAGQSRANIAGEVLIPDNRSMSYGTVPIGFAFSDVQIATGDDMAPVAVDAVVFDAVYDLAARQAQISRFDFLAGEASLSMLGFVRQAPGSPGIALRGSAARMSMDVFKSLWPEGLAPQTREWIMRQLHGGEIVDTTVNIDIKPGELAERGGFGNLPRGAVTVSFTTANTEFGYFYDLPPIRDAQLKGVWTPSSFEIEIIGDNAHVLLPEGGDIRLTGGSYRIDDTRVHPVHANLEIFTEGPLGTHLKLIDYDPLNITSKNNLDLAKIDGQASVRMTMDFDLQDGLTVADTGLIVKGTIEDLRFPAGDGRDIEKANVTLNIANGIMQVAGKGEIAGVNAEIAMTQTLYGGSQISERRVALILDEKSRKALGLDFGNLVQGAFPVDVIELGQGRRRVEANLKDARLFQPAVGLDKPAGSPATFTAILSSDKESGGTSLTDIRLSGRELFIAGSGLVRKNGSVARLDLDSFRLQSDDSASAQLRTDANGDFTARIEAVRFDMRRILDNAKTGGLSQGGKGIKKSYTVSADIGSGRGYNGEILQSVDIDLDLRGDTISDLKMTGTFADNSTMRLEIAPARGGGDPVLSMTSNNAGRMLRWLDLYSRVRGGQVGMRARLGPGSGDLRGRFQVVNFAIDQDPSLSTLINQTGKMAQDPSWQAAVQRAAPNAANVGFDELYVDFTRSSGVMDLRNGVLRGPVVGATFDGRVNFPVQQINVNGTYVPLYAINNFFGRVPLLGTILGGRANEGLIGVNFGVQGNLNRPNLVVNPVSAVTPGIFRLLLDAPSRPMPGEGQGPRVNPLPVPADRLDPLGGQPSR